MSLAPKHFAKLSEVYVGIAALVVAVLVALVACGPRPTPPQTPPMNPADVTTVVDATLDVLVDVASPLDVLMDAPRDAGQPDNADSADVVCEGGQPPCAPSGRYASCPGSNNNDNCGICFNACSGGAYCDGGTCVSPPSNCAGQMCNGICVTDFGTSQHCGSCTHNCLGLICSGGRCSGCAPPNGSQGNCPSGERCGTDHICR